MPYMVTRTRRLWQHRGGGERARRDDAAGQRQGPLIHKDAAAETDMVLGEFYHYQGAWKFRAIGQGYASGLVGIAQDFGVAMLANPPFEALISLFSPRSAAKKPHPLRGLDLRLGAKLSALPVPQHAFQGLRVAESATRATSDLRPTASTSPNGLNYAT
jgi:hypothetical protein